MAYNVKRTMDNLDSTPKINGLLPKTTNRNLDTDYLDDNSAVSKTVKLLIANAIKAKATTLHIEPWGKSVGIRYRIDGTLRHANNLPKNTLNAIVSRIKVLAKLEIEPQQMPKEGQFQINIGPNTYNLGVTILPVTDGENVVLRIQNQSEKPRTLEKLGFWGPSLLSVDRILKQPSGLVLVCGPKVSGKSTTLFEMLTILNTPAVHISTLENPIKYKIPHANQLQINQKTGLSYTASLRAILRTNPDILMVEQIDKKKTAELCIQAAHNGKLVFASTHMNQISNCSAWTANMEIAPHMFAGSLRAIINQRLVRRLCTLCRKSTKPNSAGLKQIVDYFDINSPTVFGQIHQLEETCQTKKGALLSTDEKKINKLWVANADGCASCGHTGYKGRIGLFEVLENSPEIQQLIIHKTGNQTIQNEATKNGMVLLKTDGLVKALCGQTTIAEVMQATK